MMALLCEHSLVTEGSGAYYVYIDIYIYIYIDSDSGGESREGQAEKSNTSLMHSTDLLLLKNIPYYK